MKQKDLSKIKENVKLMKEIIKQIQIKLDVKNEEGIVKFISDILGKLNNKGIDKQEMRKMIWEIRESRRLIYDDIVESEKFGEIDEINEILFEEKLTNEQIEKLNILLEEYKIKEFYELEERLKIKERVNISINKIGCG
ncbi:hypothetical protein C1646_681889 [Rhizophagus diaphanus]|nr:hypothetical protein C1646_681889 [Rhizophagus diaphanus] [Rhizophagus sp. MUCL 43196]